MPNNSTSGYPKTSQTLEKLSLKNLAVEILLEKFDSEISDGKSFYINKNLVENWEMAKNHAKKIFLLKDWQLQGGKIGRKLIIRKSDGESPT